MTAKEDKNTRLNDFIVATKRRRRRIRKFVKSNEAGVTDTNEWFRRSMEKLTWK